MSTRLDLYLIRHAYFTSRALAQDAIKEGRILVNDKMITKNSYLIDDDNKITILEKEHAFASRAGTKLYHALQHFELDLTDRIVIDVGASTGGFSDVCLEAGAKLVYAVDVGKDQLIERLRNHPRLKNMEGVNCRYLHKDMFTHPSFACIDVSFISLKLILPSLFTILKEPFDIIALIKPQFEAGSKDVGKKGIVKDWRVHVRVLQEMVDFIHASGYGVKHLEASSIRGRDGNKEFVMHITNHTMNTKFNYKEIIMKY